MDNLRMEILEQNNFVFIDPITIKHLPTDKIFFAMEIEKLSDFEFNRFIESRCLYETTNKPL